MTVKVVVFLLSLWMLKCFKEGLSLRCYECTESDHSSCGDNFNPKNVTTIDCDTSIYTIDPRIGEHGNSFSCLYVKETNSSTKESTYTRRCTVKYLNDSCDHISAKNQANGIQTYCRQCDGDLCNSSQQFDASFFVIFLFFLLFIVRV